MVERVIDGRKKDTFAFALTEEQKKREKEAAVKLQAILRGHLARKQKEKKKKKKKKKKAEERKRKIDERPPPPPAAPPVAPTPAATQK